MASDHGLRGVVPILRSFDEVKAREFYLDWLGVKRSFAIRMSHMPGIGISSMISIEPSGIMKCGCSDIAAASASFDSACMTE